MIVFTLGMPGSGKTSVAKLVAERIPLDYVGAGDVARKLAERDEETKLALSLGCVAPPAKMRAAMMMRIDHDTIVDGYPRYLEQLVDAAFAMHRRKIDMRDVFYVYHACEEEVAIRRLLDRRRSDDEIAQIGERVKTFRDRTMPVVQYAIENFPDQMICIPKGYDVRDSASLVVSELYRHYRQ